ncbi:MAG: amino acid permease, partial [Candidatus Aminicenantes bacterium]|nr:amino acid permease [Candidatus Aminicenantes bacterium]
MDDRRSSGGNELRASLGLFDSTMLVVGAVFGSGIFLTTGIIAAQIPFSGVIWLAWFGGGLVTIAGALCYGELGSLFPKAGGPYVYLQRAYGRGAAFFFGWTFFWIIGGGGIAALAVGFSEYAGFLGLGLPRPVLAVLAVWMLTALNAFGVGLGSRIQAGLAAVRILAVLALAGGAAVLAVKSGLTNIHPVWPSAAREFSWTAMGAAMVAVFWAYDGWYSVNCTAEEIRSPAATIPRS